MPRSAATLAFLPGPVLLLSACLLLLGQLAPAAERELIGDPHFARGCVLSEPKTGRHVPYGAIGGVSPGSKPLWLLAQWSSRQKLALSPPQELPSGALSYTNAAKAVTFGPPGSPQADLTLAVNGAYEYGGRPRTNGEPWVHLLVEQWFENPPALTALSHASLHIAARLTKFHRCDMPGYSPGLHAATLQIFFTLQNKNPKSAGCGQYLWFGVPLYDDREAIPPSYQAKDVGKEDATGMFIYTVAGSALTAQSLHEPQWVTIDKDLLPFMTESLKSAWQRGFLKESQSPADYRITSVNLGWEVTGIFDVAIQLRDLSLKVSEEPAVIALPAAMDATAAGSGRGAAATLEARGHNPNALEGLRVQPAGGMKLTVTAGKARVLGREVLVPQTTLEIAPAARLQVNDEATTLTDELPVGYEKGTALLQCYGIAASVACLDSGSIVIKQKPGPDALVYAQGKDWRADEVWGRVGRLPAGRIAAGQTVYIDYRVRLLRVDTLCISPSGHVGVNQGDSQKVCPSIPAADYGSLALCHIFLDYDCRQLTPKAIYPVGPAFLPDPATLQASRPWVAKTRAKLEQGKDVTIVAWGDSVTAGGDASRPELRFCDAFVQALRYKYPNARIKLVNAGRGGWNSNMSLPLFQDDVLKHKPDLVTMEFVNDMGMDEANLRKNWYEAIDRVRALGGEALVVTPHFVMPMWMRFADDSTPETRPSVEVLRKIAREKQVPVADASKRWEHLALEGVPYVIHFRNGINHPDDFGHALFVEELLRLF